MAIGLNNLLNQAGLLNSLNDSTRSLSSSFRKISSGQGVTRASDDAAALSISTALNSDQQSSLQAINNIGAGISILRTAEGGLDQIGSLLTRAKELVIQGAGSALDPSARQSIQTEIDSIKSEISRIAGTTEFNGQKLLDGSLAPSSENQTAIQVGIDSSPASRISLNAINGTTAAELGLDALDVSSAGNAQSSIDSIDSALAQINGERAGVGSLQNRFETAAANLGVASENLLSSIETLTGLDVAKEASDLKKNQTIQNAAILVQKRGNYLNQLLTGQLLDLKG